ncbi:StbB family protein [Roseateles sp.]|uniref:StbB family protein n=1 Tax=Roseateles sp. TaxID=1971397 RepID=UPI003263CAC0
MKLAVINFSGNVGKTTLARHLLLPRIPGAEYIAVETINAGAEGQASLRGDQFAMLQEYLLSIDSAVVDIGASTVDDLMDLMAQYGGSHEDFDCFIVPTVPDPKQQQDTIATLVDLARLGVPPERMRLVFNTMELGVTVEQAFYLVLGFLHEHPLAIANPECALRRNEIYARVRGLSTDFLTLSQDPTDYKRLIARAQNQADKMALGQKLATRRLAGSVLVELDRCFTALGLPSAADSAGMSMVTGEAQ